MSGSLYKPSFPVCIVLLHSFSAAFILLFWKIDILCSEYSLINIVIDYLNGTGDFFFMSIINVGNRLSLLKKRFQKAIQFIKLLTWQGNSFLGSLQLLDNKNMAVRICKYEYIHCRRMKHGKYFYRHQTAICHNGSYTPFSDSYAIQYPGDSLGINALQDTDI